MSYAEWITDGYARYSRRDPTFVDDSFAPDIRWRVPGPQGNLQGTAAVKEFFKGLTEQFSAHRIEMIDSLEGGDNLWCHVRHHFTTHDGTEHKVEAVHMWQVADGKATSLVEVADTLGFAIAAGWIPAEALQGS